VGIKLLDRPSGIVALSEPVPEALRRPRDAAARVADGAEVAGEVESAHRERVERAGAALGLDDELGEECKPACVEGALDALGAWKDQPVVLISPPLSRRPAD
jgi:hypothetical protein